MPPPTFTMEQDLTLIRLVEQNPVTYIHGFAGKDEREVAWQKIGDALQKLVPVCKARWSNIRDNLRRTLRSRQRKSKDPYFLGKTFTKFKYEDHLGFLVTFLKDKIKEFDEDEADESEISEVEKTEEIFLVVDEDNKENNEANSSNKIDKRSNRSNNNIVSTSVERHTEPTSIKAFLSAIEATLGELNPYYLNKAKSKIFKIVQECELEQIINKGKEPVVDESE